MRTIWRIAIGGILCIRSATAETPTLTRTEPADGATNVATTIDALRFYFDRNMDPTSWTFSEAPVGRFPPQLVFGSNPWLDSRCAQMRVTDLEPNTTYAVQLNSAEQQGFRSANGDTPLSATVVSFTTRGDGTVPPTYRIAPVVSVPATQGRFPFRAYIPQEAPISSNAPASPSNALGLDITPPAVAQASAARPACPRGWATFKNPIVGMEAHLPAGYWVRLRGGLMLTVEKQDSPATMAFMVPMRPRPEAKAAAIAEQFSRFAARSEPGFRAQVVAAPSADVALSRFSTLAAGQPVEGKYCALKAAGGSMAYVIGITAPQGRLAEERAVLEQIVQSFSFTPPRGKWIDYKSPAGGFTLEIPQDWDVQASEGRSGAEAPEWTARDPQNPLSRAFQWSPCYRWPRPQRESARVVRGGLVEEFPSHEQVVMTSLLQVAQAPKLVKMNLNDQITGLLHPFDVTTSKPSAPSDVARTDTIAYDCLAKGQLEGRPVLLAFTAAIRTTVSAGGLAPAGELSVTLRGWCAEPARFVNDTPVLERVCSSMELAPAFLRQLASQNAVAAEWVRQTHETMSSMNLQVYQSHWGLMDAVAEMNYDALRDYAGYVNGMTGRIEPIPPDRLVTNSRGQLVSAEESRGGAGRDRATVLRPASADDYMRGAYGRATFSF